jgi:hypothetical protein
MLAAGLVLLDRGDQLTLAHAARSGDAELRCDLLQVGHEQLGEVTDRTALRPGGGGGTFWTGGRLTDGGILRRGGRARKEFGGVAH